MKILSPGCRILRPPAAIRAGRASLSAIAMLTSLATHAADGAAPAQRPPLQTNRWQEDWSALADPALRTESLDPLKYIPLSDTDPARYLSLGLTLRERAESNDAASFGAGAAHRDRYLLQRLQVHADLHLTSHLRVFTQLEDARAWRKTSASSVDRNPLDLRLAFAEYTRSTALGTFKARIGRQDFAFDLQRYVSSRDGPNVRQSFDAVWADWETTNWRVNGFVSRPVQYLDGRPFDDHSGDAWRFDTLRVERHVLGANELSAYVARYDRAAARYGDAIGAEHRDILDARFAGKRSDIDWDVEAMGQDGHVGAKAIRAWAAGARMGYTFGETDWQPRIGVQFDAASGDRRSGDGTLGTFNPLFPNGYYFSLAGYTGDANLVHAKPSVTLRPASNLTLLIAAGLVWRQTVADAIYVQPNVPVAGTVGKGRRWTGAYGQLRADYVIDRHTTCALEAVRYDVGRTLQDSGGHDSTYVGAEAKVMW